MSPNPRPLDGADNVASVPPGIYTREYYLSEAAGWKEFRDSHGARLQYRDRRVVEALDLCPGQRVLDIGCGRGEILLHALSIGLRVVGIDYSQAAVELAAETLRRGKRAAADTQGWVLKADCKALPFQANSFDRVAMVDVVEHLYPGELRVALREARRVLKPGGLLLVHTTPNRWYAECGYGLERLLHSLLCGRAGGASAILERRFTWRLPRSAYHRSMHVNELSPFGLRRALAEAGFRTQLFFLPVRESSVGALTRLGRCLLQCVPPFSYLFASELWARGRK